MKRPNTYYKTLLFAVFFANITGFAQLPVWFDAGLGVSFPDGGIHFNTKNTHYPGPSFFFIGQTTWNNNWFELDSLMIGAELSSHFANARNNTINGLFIDEDLRFTSLFVNVSRYFTLMKSHPFCNLSIGLSTMTTSEGNFVLSSGGVIRGGVYFDYPKFSPGISFGYNAPWIAFRNTLTGFWEVTLHVRSLSKVIYPKKQRQVSSYSSE